MHCCIENASSIGSEANEKGSLKFFLVNTWANFLDFIGILDSGASVLQKAAVLFSFSCVVSVL